MAICQTEAGSRHQGLWRIIFLSDTKGPGHFFDVVLLWRIRLSTLTGCAIIHHLHNPQPLGADNTCGGQMSLAQMT